MAVVISGYNTAAIDTIRFPKRKEFGAFLRGKISGNFFLREETRETGVLASKICMIGWRNCTETM